MTKKALRKIYLERRKALHSEELNHKSKAISQRFFEEVYQDRFRFIHTFLPILRHREIDTWLIIKKLKELQSPPNLVISKSDLATSEMRHFLLEENLKMEENPWGILEPIGGLAVDDRQIDLVLIPMLIFDQQGQRVGYGKGFYDRFLEKCRPDCLKVGLCIEPPVEKIADATPHDIGMDVVITPQQVFEFRRS